MNARTKAALAKHKLWGIALRPKQAAENAIRVGASRVGGRPDMPLAGAWPTAVRKAKGKSVELPLAFVAQIALADVARLDRERTLPKDGLLSFFVLDALRVMRAVGLSKKELQKTDRVRVLYTPAGVKLARRDPPPELPPSHVGPTSKLGFQKVETWPQVEGTIVRGSGDKGLVTLAADDWMEWAQDAPSPPRCGMLGHPYGCEFPIGTERDARLLLALDVKESGLPWDFFGRNGFLYVYAPAKAIRAGQWEAAAHKEW